ncbi:LINE-1 type transposase domain-containing protein 1 [Labeo rohita]|uniref:LINE-1 type transposase domain-containing protein 1 n=1 Tax=Labeo rohita TaxID=84645 RepID=A0ABQ8L5A4_LABRO|nr:LINE-1 type transposase domain-containing protein 1 [Labeo rohita]
MPPKSIKPGQQPRFQSQTGSGNGEQASKLTASEQSDANGNDSTNSILLAIQSLRDDMTKQSSDMLEAINGFKTELMSHSKRIGEAEDRISQTEEDVTTLRQKAKKLEQTVETLTNKIQDLEDGGRRSNLRMVGLPEKAEGSDACAFLEDWLPKVLTDCFSTTPIIERAHRVGQINANRPRPIVMKFLNYKDREKTLRAARKLKELRYGDQRVNLFPDLSAETRQRQRCFDGVKAQMKSMDIRYGMLYPAHLIVTHADKQRIFKTVSEETKLA